MKTQNQGVTLPTSMLDVFRDLYDVRVARHINSREMVSQVKDLNLQYVVFGVAYLILLIISTCAVYNLRTWATAGTSALTLLISASIFNAYLQRSKREVEQNEECLALYLKLEELFRKIWATGRIPQVKHTLELAFELENGLREAVSLILSLQCEKEKDSTEEIQELQSFVKNDTALIVRLELMFTNLIEIDDSGEMSDEEFFDARAHWFCEKLFENPEFRML